MQRPNHAGMRHVAINVIDLELIKDFYVSIFGFSIEWQPDDNDLYLTSGADNLAFHRVEDVGGTAQKLDHIGFIVDQPEDVDAWYDYLSKYDIEFINQPKTHRDGARSFYCYDPEKNVIQIIFHPPISAGGNNT